MSFEQPEKQEQINRSKELADALLVGKMSKAEFLKQIDDLDQSTPVHADSIKNAVVLESVAVRDLFVGDPDFENIRSLTHFHVGQIRAMQEKFDEAIRAFDQSLTAAQTIKDDDYQDWVEYVRATLAYLKHDLGTLEAISKAGKAMNPEVIDRLRKGLQETGTVDYRRDYGE